MKLEFGDELRNIMIKEDLNQVEISRKTGISEQTISRYLHSKRSPTVKIAEGLLNTLGYELIIQERSKRKK